MSCDLQAAGTIELYFYGELPQADRAAVQAHLARCAECRAALEDLSVIRAALANRPDVATPPGGDWSGFMRRLTAAVAAEQSLRGPSNATPARPLRRQLAPYLAVATLAVVSFALITERNPRPAPGATSVVTAPPTAGAAGAQPLRDASLTATDPDPGLLAVSGEHFERSKLVVLGLVTKSGSQDDWAYERGLASSLLGDTRLYRQAAEERGMQPLADVMGDLELVLLQTSMADQPNEASLHQLQRLIRRRDLLTKMNAY
jgi:hypothetical protein